jgi:P pilus assembly chaperone PapD
MKLFAWTQDAAGQDVLADSSDLIYFPRQMEVDPGARRLVRVGIKAPATGAERAYRLFIEEEPDPAQPQGRAQVAIYFRFGVPVFVAPPGAKAQPEVGPPTLASGRMSVLVRNAGNRHLRLTRVVFSDGAGFRQEQQGWYSLAGSERTYAAEIPADICRKARTLQVLLEGENLRIERTLDVDPAACA